MRLVLALVVVFTTGCHSLYPNNSGVVHLNYKNFEKTVKNSADVWVVQFYSPGCGYCKQFEPEYIKAASELKDRVKFGVADDPYLDYEYEISDIPTVKIFAANKDEPETCDGPREADDLIECIKRKL